MGGKSVVVAGLGNIGSHLVRSLARMPEVGRIVLVDKDSYEARNALNQDIEPQRDVAKSKAAVQAQRLLEIRPELEVAAFHMPLENLPLGVWRADLVLAGLDGRGPRQVVNERAWRWGVPWIDSGVLGSQFLARVNVYAPAGDAPCIECAWTDEDYRLIQQRYPCLGAGNSPAPTGASAELGALAASLLAIECRKMLTGDRECAAIGRQVTVNARWHGLTVTSFRRNARCRFDHATWRIEPLRVNTGETRIADLLERGRAIRIPGQRFVRRLVCFACRMEKRMFHLEGSLDPAGRQCGGCGEPMSPTGFDIVESLDDTLPVEIQCQTLDEAGLRYGDVIQTGDRYFEIIATSCDRDKNCE